jgi:hypothetical protein
MKTKHLTIKTFEDWYLDTQRRYKGFLVIPQEDFYVLPIAMRFGIYQDFFYKMGMNVYIKPHGEKFNVYIDSVETAGHHILTENLILDTLNDARAEAIVMAGKFLEEQLGNESLSKPEIFERGDTILATFGYNTIKNEPFKFLYDFAYYSPTHCIVYRHGEQNMQDAHAFKLDQIRKATKDDLKKYSWGK